MYIPFKEMPSSSRIWIYQADRVLSPADITQIDERCQEFLSGWAAHGSPLKSSSQVFHDKFLVICVDENHSQASGCSIDASVSLIRSIEAGLKINFFDRSKVCFMVGDEIFDSPLADIKKHIESGKISPSILTFNNLVTNIESLNHEWLIKAENSWLKRYF
jgi:hypothetical protein